MHAAWLEGADAEAVSDAVTRVLEARGAVVTEHTRSHVAFESLRILPEAPAGAHTFERGGNATLVAPAGEREVEVRLRLRARFTSKLFWWTLSVELAIALLTVILSPGPSGWFAIGIGLWLVFLVVAILHLGTIPGSRRAERELLAAILLEAGADAERALTEEERLKAAAVAEAEAEALERDLRAKKKGG